MKPLLDNLVWIHENLANGGTVFRWKDFQFVVYERTSWPNLLVGLNNDTYDGWKTVTVQTGFGANVQLHDYSGHAGDVWTDGQGNVTIGIPPNNNGAGYVCYSRAGLEKPNPRARRRDDAGVRRRGRSRHRPRCWRRHRDGRARSGARPDPRSTLDPLGSDPPHFVFLDLIRRGIRCRFKIGKASARIAAGIRCKSLRPSRDPRRSRSRSRTPHPVSVAHKIDDRHVFAGFDRARGFAGIRAGGCSDPAQRQRPQRCQCFTKRS